MRIRGCFERGARLESGKHLGLVLMILLAPLPLHWVLWKRTFGGIYYETTSLTVYPFDAANFLFLATASFSQSWRGTPWRGEKRLIAPLSALVLLAATSTLWAADFLLAAQLALRLLALLATALLLMRMGPAERLVQASLAAMLLVQSGAALLQFSGQDDLGLRWLGELDLNRYPGGGSVLSAGGAYWIRAYGLTAHPNILGGLLATALLALTAKLLVSSRRHFPLLLLLFLAGASGLFVTFSRSAWLGGAVGGLFLVAVVWWHPAWRRAYGGRLVILSLAISVTLGGLGWRYRDLLISRSGAGGELEVRSLDERAWLNQAGRILIEMAPLTGTGANNSTVALLPQVEGVAGVGPQPIHNMVLLVTAELGIAGGMLWFWLMLAPIWLSLVRLRQGKLSLWALALAAALVSFAVIDLFDYYAWLWMAGRSWRWLLWGMWGAAVSQTATQTTTVMRT